jgi:hypothetical protein
MPHTTDTQQLTTADLADTARGRDMQEPDMQQEPRPELQSPEDRHSGPLLTPDLSQEMRSRWEAIQTAFVDDPRVSVQRADELVAMAITKLAESFADERARLEQLWSKGSDVSTEDMRQTIRRYRSFFQRLLSV